MTLTFESVKNSVKCVGLLAKQRPRTVSFFIELQVCGLRTHGHVIQQGMHLVWQVTCALVRCASQRLFYSKAHPSYEVGSWTRGSAARSPPTSLSPQFAVDILVFARAQLLSLSASPAFVQRCRATASKCHATDSHNSKSKNYNWAVVRTFHGGSKAYRQYTGNQV